MVRPALNMQAQYGTHTIRSTSDHSNGPSEEPLDLLGGNFYDPSPGCVTAMINQLKWEPLEYRRLTSRLVMFYKITHDLIDINAPSYIGNDHLT